MLGEPSPAQVASNERIEQLRKELIEQLQSVPNHEYMELRARRLKIIDEKRAEENEKLFESFYQERLKRDKVTIGWMRFLNRLFRLHKYRVDEWNTVMAEACALEALQHPTPDNDRRRRVCYAKLTILRGN